MRCMAFDLGTRQVGVAWADGNGPPAWTTHSLPHVGSDGAYFLIEIRLMLHGLFSDFQPEHIIYESPIRVPDNELWTTRKMYAAGLFLELYAHDKNVPCHEELPGPVRARFLGEGNTPRRRDPIKAAVMAECQRRGWAVTTDDEADALALLAFLRVELGITGTAAPLLEYQAEGAHA